MELVTEMGHGLDEDQDSKVEAGELGLVPGSSSKKNFLPAFLLLII